MFWSIIHRTIFMDLLRVFLMALAALTSLLLLAGIIAEASQHGLGPAQILAAIPLLIPSTLPYTLPATTLFASCVVFGRLSNDNEILALKSAGIHLRHVIWPAAFLGVIVSAVTIGLSLDVIPTTHHMLRTKVVTDVEDFLYNMLRREGCIRHPKINYTIYVKRVLGKKLIDATFMRKDPKGERFDVIARAQEAELLFDLNKRQILVKMYRCRITDEHNVAEDKLRVWPVEIPPDFFPTSKASARAMTWPELFENIVRFKELLQINLTEIAKHQAALLQRVAEPHFDDHVKDLQNARKYYHLQIWALITEIHMRVALSCGCFFFVMVGCPIGIWFSRSDYLSAFITCFLPIVVIYYPVLLCSINLAKNGTVAPVFALHAANGLMAVIALGLFRRLLRN
ncbi:MAG: LptF/LptG family permease [Planctomycetes bacterium]|nr:LptF/LptG family permease [Planctomycetota bacterium]